MGINESNPKVALHVNGTIMAEHIIASKVTLDITDPVYNIKGIKYSTYGLFSIGLREELKDIVELGDNRQYTIDFTSSEEGSDAWLFWHVIGRKTDDISVVLTPGFKGTVWYAKSNDKLTFFGSRQGEVSFQLSAPRFDSDEWGNYADVEDYVTGIKID